MRVSSSARTERRAESVASNASGSISDARRPASASTLRKREIGNTSERCTLIQRCASDSTPAAVGVAAKCSALMAPAEAPTTNAGTIPCATRARNIPTSAAAVLPPPANTNAVRICQPGRYGARMCSVIAEVPHCSRNCAASRCTSGKLYCTVSTCDSCSTATSTRSTSADVPGYGVC